MKEKRNRIHWGLTVFLTVAAILLFYDTLFGSRTAILLFRQLVRAVQPVLYGVLIAYLLSPVVDFFEGHLFARRVEAAKSGGRWRSRRARALSLLLTWAIICLAAYLLASVLLPELYRSVVQLFNNIETYYQTIVTWVEHLLESNQTWESFVTKQLAQYYQDISSWLTTDLLPHATALMGTVTGGLVSAMNFVLDLLVGIIVSVYLLATKEQCAALARKIVCGIFSPRDARWVFRGVRKVDEIFSGFVRGKLLDSLIIGIICFVGCSILKFPYTPLVSVIVGVTNVIPFFGPFLGAVPSIFLILLVSPIQALYFAIFVLALQQLDGNVIGPLILGDRTGLSSLWVIIAILVGGSFFGVPGMFFGVPVCACLYSAVNFFIDTRLRKKHLPVDAAAYSAGRFPQAQSPAGTDGGGEEPPSGGDGPAPA